MTDQTEAQNTESGPALPPTVTEQAQVGETAPTVKQFTMGDIAKRYFAPDQLDDAKEYIRKIVPVCPEGKISRNFKPEEDFPDGYGLAVVPIAERGKDGKGNTTIAIAIAAIPDPAMVANHEKGASFIRDTLTTVFMSRVANACRPKDGLKPEEATFPFTIEDFIESRRGKDSLKAFSEIANTFVKALRKKGIKYMTPGLLRQTLQSKAFAETQFEKIAQAAWQKILDAMIVKAQSKGLDPAILVNWKEVRDSAEVLEINDLDLDDLDELIGD